MQRPSDGTGDFIVEFDDKTYEVKVDEKTNQGVVSFENFTKLGEQIISIKYHDDKYPLKNFINLFTFLKNSTFLPVLNMVIVKISH